jgi:hypothetical protein
MSRPRVSRIAGIVNLLTTDGNGIEDSIFVYDNDDYDDDNDE